MNLLLLEESDFIAPDRVRITAPDRVRITGRRHKQLYEVIHAEPGKRCKAGLLNGPVGTAELISITPEAAELVPSLDREPPPPLPVTLAVALPRPPTFVKVLHCATTMGVKRFFFLTTRKAEKSYWSSPAITPPEVAETLKLALEQCGDTVMPQVEFRRDFHRFVREELPLLAAESDLFLGHPSAVRPLPTRLERPATLLIGPEGGFTDSEVELFTGCGATPVTLGRRTLRTEFAVPALLAKLTAENTEFL